MQQTFIVKSFVYLQTTKKKTLTLNIPKQTYLGCSAAIFKRMG